MKTLFSLFVITIYTAQLFSQSIADNELKVVKDFYTEIYKAEPIYRNYTNALIRSDQRDNYKDSLISLDSKTETAFDLEVKPVPFIKEEPIYVSNGFLKVNKGSLSEWDGELFYKYQVDNYFDISLNAEYLKWNEEIILNKEFELYNIGTNLNYYLSDKILSNIKIAGGKNTFGKYGQNIIPSERENDFQRTEHYEIAHTIRSFNSAEKKVNFRLKSMLRTFKNDLMGIKENIVLIDPSISYSFSSKMSLQLESSNTISRNNGLQNLRNHNAKLFIRTNTNRISLNWGASFNLSKDELSFYPSLYANYYLSSEEFITINISEKNSYVGADYINNINPYVAFDRIVPFISRKRKHSVGFDKWFMQKVKAQLLIGFDRIENDINFSSFDEEANILFNQVDYNKAYLTISASYDLNKIFHNSIRMSYAHYDAMDILYLKPQFELTYNFGFNTANDKLEVNLNANFSSSQNLSVSTFTGLNQSGIRKNLDIGAVFRPINNLTISAGIQNVLNDNFQVFDGYGVFGRNVSAGVIVKL